MGREWRIDPDDNSPYTFDTFMLQHQELAVQRWRTAVPCEPPRDPNFLQIAPVIAYGDLAKGAGLRCPRDGKLSCSIVDAVHQEKLSGPANEFVSWVWGYPMS